MDDQSQTLAFLGSGAGLGAQATRIDTHSSSVFLIGERVLKLKRAVRFSYLDYSTVALREAACRAEHDVNRPLAPTIYLGVRGITRRADGTMGLDGEGETLDWVLEMRRFPAEGLFDRLASDGALSPLLMRELADVIAAFHKTAEPAAHYGGAHGMTRIVDGNLANLRVAGAMLDQEAVTRLDRATRAALAAVAPLLDKRREAGLVRRCHGDLHLGNICLVDDHPALFDAIEFSAEIASTDTFYDLAFLLMDLVHRDLGALANLVMNRYVDRTRDEEGLGALPLFLSVRAAIRAHVTAAAAARETEGEARDKRIDLARRYLALAERLLERVPPRLIAIGGLSGSGKSTVAQAIAPEIGAPPGARMLRSDVLRKAMLDLAPEASLPASAYQGAMGGQVYALMMHEAARHAGTGTSVILDATFIDPKERDAAGQVAANAGVPFIGIWLGAERKVMAARIDERKGDASDATVAVLDRQLGGDPGPITWNRVPSGGSLTRTLAAVRRVLG